jgi:hypothetical protein
VAQLEGWRAGGGLVFWFPRVLKEKDVWGTGCIYSRLSIIRGNGADNQRINRSTHTQARYTGIKLTSLIFYAIN